MADYSEYAKQAAARYASVMPTGYEEDYRRRQLARFGEEVPAAQAMLQGMESGETSQALAAQRFGIGQMAGQQAQLAASGAPKAPGGIANPLGVRQAMFGGAEQAQQMAMQGAQARAGEIGKAYDAALSAQMRQAGYGLGLEQEMLRRQQMMRQARQATIEAQMGEDFAERQRNVALAQGAMAAGTQIIGAGMRSSAQKPGG